MKQALLADNRIRLRAPELKDLDRMYETENDTSFWECGCVTSPYSGFALKQYIENTQNDLFMEKQMRLIIERKVDSQAVGIIDLYDFVPLHSHAAVGIVVFSSFRKEGYATGALKLLCDYVYRFLHLKQLYAYTAVDNQACLRLFSSCSFVECGRLKGWLHSEEGYKDVAMVQRIF
ncbi:Spermidine N(1)-acetyltransferase [termite gut metagenome]|uniref:Spermidine N(1)-acetyltransferase n=1 Tax=termite gut metagenome TaxID=433724 RepID=A0A5J4T053_9ZZZZ